MAPKVPEEIDVFTAPHSRMKELVNIYTRKMSCVDFRDVPEVVSLLQDLDTTLCEFKSHESIENIFIMDQLKNRLKQHQISNTAVCDCHNDTQLSDVVKLVRRGTQVRERSVGERITFGLQLQQAFQDFVNTFLPHMEEEEQVFQPMLVEYFEYDELKILKEIVLKEHELAKDRTLVEKAQDCQEGQPETHASVKDLRDLDWDLCSLAEPQEKEPGGLNSPPPLPLPPEPDLPPDSHLSTTTDSQTLHHTFSHIQNHQTTTQSYHNPPHYHTPFPSNHYNPFPAFRIYHNHNHTEEINHTPDLHYQNNHHIPPDVFYASTSSTSVLALPVDVLVEIFSYLSPNELCKCAQVCSEWNSAVFSPTLWSSLYPVQWARGIWERRNVGLSDVLEEEAYQKQQQQYGRGSRKWDEDADVDEAEEGEDEEAMREYRVMESLVLWVLPRVGVGVTTLVVDAGLGITSRLLHQALLLCPNLTHLSASHTPIDSYTFKGLWLQGGLPKLRHLDLQGCQLIDDSALQYLSLCVGRGDTQNVLPSPPCMEVLVYEGCHRCGYSGPAWPNMPCQRRNRTRDERQGFGSWINSPHVDIEEIHCPRGPEVMEDGCRSNSQSLKRMSLVMENSYPYLNSSQSYDPQTLDWDTTEDLCRNGTQSSQQTSHYPYTKATYHPNLDVTEDSLYRGSKPPSLVYLNLSGCWHVTDKGLLALATAGLLIRLAFLDVSGCSQLSGSGLEVVTRLCPSLHAEKLWYCDDILNGPFPATANGCANLANPVRTCCRSGQ